MAASPAAEAIARVICSARLRRPGARFYRTFRHGVRSVRQGIAASDEAQFGARGRSTRPLPAGCGGARLSVMPCCGAFGTGDAFARGSSGG